MGIIFEKFLPYRRIPRNRFGLCHCYLNWKKLMQLTQSRVPCDASNNSSWVHLGGQKSLIPWVRNYLSGLGEESFQFTLNLRGLWQLAPVEQTCPIHQLEAHAWVFQPPAFQTEATQKLHCRQRSAWHSINGMTECLCACIRKHRLLPTRHFMS